MNNAGGEGASLYITVATVAHPAAVFHSLSRGYEIIPLPAWFRVRLCLRRRLSSPLLPPPWRLSGSPPAHIRPWWMTAWRSRRFDCKRLRSRVDSSELRALPVLLLQSSEVRKFIEVRLKVCGFLVWGLRVSPAKSRPSRSLSVSPPGARGARFIPTSPRPPLWNAMHLQTGTTLWNLISPWYLKASKYIRLPDPAAVGA